MGDFSLKVLNIVKKYKWEFAAVVFLIIGSLVRLVALGSVPNGLNVDEASSGYDAWSIMRYGIDRGGNSYPVYLYAWGSGQSALYSYLMIPVLALGGLTEFTMRLPMAIFGVVSLIVFYFLVRNIFDDKRLSLVALGFFAICPCAIYQKDIQQIFVSADRVFNNIYQWSSHVYSIDNTLFSIKAVSLSSNPYFL